MLTYQPNEEIYQSLQEVKAGECINAYMNRFGRTFLFCNFTD